MRGVDALEVVVGGDVRIVVVGEEIVDLGVSTNYCSVIVAYLVIFLVSTMVEVLVCLFEKTVTYSVSNSRVT